MRVYRYCLRLLAAVILFYCHDMSYINNSISLSLT